MVVAWWRDCWFCIPVFDCLRRFVEVGFVDRDG